jgi:pyridoxal phosphate enzyme (YggS family)
MIGHLQTNKVKLIAPFIYMIQSVDSIKILNQINKYAKKNKRIINCLIQVKVSTDLNKFGFSVNDFNLFVKSDFKKEFPFVYIRGLMCISSFTSDKQKIRKEFKLLKKLSKKLNMDAPIVSMGMSNDYQIALQEGSNMLRLGTIIFS